MCRLKAKMKLSLLALSGILFHVMVAQPADIDINKNSLHLAFNNNQDSHLWEKSGKIEGDIVLTPEQEKNLYFKNTERNGVNKKKLRWPNRKIPYIISNDFTTSEAQWIRQVLEEDYARSCVKPVPRTNERDYVYITGKNTGCWSYVGRTGKKQVLNLERNGCLSYSTIVHEFLHAAGFHHQQSTSDRDNYVTIQKKNIQKGEANNFKKYSAKAVSSFGEKYDYGSVMHYHAYAFSKNGEKTIVPKQNVAIGVAPKMSAIDVAKLNKMYGC